MPNTIIKILTNIDLDNEYQHSFTFPNLEYQLAFFNGKLKHQIEYSTYIGEFFKNDFIKINKPIEDLIDCTYLMYQNTDSSTKYYYCFITDLEVINNENTKVYFKIDVLQTFKFDVDYHESFIEREHVAFDERTFNLKPENIDIGDTQGYQSNLGSLANLGFFMGVSESDLGAPVDGYVLQGVFTGVQILGYSSVTLLNAKIASYTDSGKVDAIKFIFTYPLQLLATWRAGTFQSGLPIITGDLSGFDWDITIPLDNIGGYSPKNEKLYSYPYYFLEMSNNNGMIRNYRIEDLTLNGNVTFKIDGSFSVGAEVCATPYAYNGQFFPFDQTVRLPSFPLCSWSTDVFANYISQSKVSLPLSIASAGLGVVASYATGNPLGVASGVIGVANTIGGIYEKSIEPNTYTGSVNTSLNVAVDKATFSYTIRYPKRENLVRIDNYFSFYGYNVSQFKNFEFETRPNWNYIKVTDPNITGNIQSKYLKEYKDVFRVGVTFWHNDNIGNYDRSNKT